MGAVLLAMTFLHVVWLGDIWRLQSGTIRTTLPWVLLGSLGGPVLLLSVPTRWGDWLYRQGTPLLQRETLVLGTLAAVAFLIGVVYATVQDVVLPDELYHLDGARLVTTQGVRTFVTKYKDVPWLGHQHPPLVPLLHGLIVYTFGPHLVVLRLVSVGLAVGTVLITYRLGCELYDQATGLRAAVFLFAMPLFVRLSAMATTDMAVTLCAVLVVRLLGQLLQQPSYRKASLAGVGLGVGLLCKYTMVLLAPVPVGLGALHTEIRHRLSHVIYLLIVASAVVTVWGVIAVQNDVWQQQFGSLTTHASQVTTSRSGRQWMLYTLQERVVPAVGWYNLPVLVLGIYALVRQRTRTAVGVLWWLAAPSLLLMITLPDPRYFVLVFPALALTLARGVAWFPQQGDRVLLLAVLSSAGVLWMAREWQYIARLFLR